MTTTPLINAAEHPDLLVGRLAARADIPVGHDTAGWEWLADVRDLVLEQACTYPDEPVHGVLHRAVESSITTTRPDLLWRTFTDVEAWREDPTYWRLDVPAPDEGGLTTLALQILHRIGYRFSEAVAEVAYPERLVADDGLIYLDPR